MSRKLLDGIFKQLHLTMGDFECRVGQECRPRERRTLMLGVLVGVAVLSLFGSPSLADDVKPANAAMPTATLQQQQIEDPRKALEAEFNAIIRQHEIQDVENKQSAEALLTRILLDTLTKSPAAAAAKLSDAPPSPDDLEGNGSSMDQQEAIGLLLNNNNSNKEFQDQPEDKRGARERYRAAMAFPTIQNTESATIKRAATRIMSKYPGSQNRYASSGYDKSSFAFGLGKRPNQPAINAGGGAGILRYGDAISGGGSQPLGSFGKRPSGPRYDFGLGKRMSSPTYPRYDFGLGKRSPTRLRYDFGLGK